MTQYNVGTGPALKNLPFSSAASRQAVIKPSASVMALTTFYNFLLSVSTLKFNLAI